VDYLPAGRGGGRPPFSIPAFIIITFETLVLFTATGVFVLFFWICRLPRLRHPLFTVPGFERVTSTAFFLGIDAADARFERERTPAELLALGATSISLAEGLS
jgi:hypothetical protein